MPRYDADIKVKNYYLPKPPKGLMRILCKVWPIGWIREKIAWFLENGSFDKPVWPRQ
jgi:hypothetical protein